MLRYFKSHLGRWCCATCASGGSNQPAAVFREVKKMGYKFEEVSPNHWAREMYCPVCRAERTHYRLLSEKPVFTPKKRLSISREQRKRVLDLLDNKDAFTGASISSVAEIDHKIPFTRLDKDINIKDLSDKEVKESFQLLTREHNLLKDRMCTECRKTGRRQPFIEIPFFYEGTDEYKGSCEGCGWHDGKKWREEAGKKLNPGSSGTKRKK